MDSQFSHLVTQALVWIDLIYLAIYLIDIEDLDYERFRIDRRNHLNNKHILLMMALEEKDNT